MTAPLLPVPAADGHGAATPQTPRYAGPLGLHAARSGLCVDRAASREYSREGLRADVEYRDLGLCASTQGRIGIKHIRAIAPLPHATGWHWHDMDAHFVYVLRGWITFRFQGVEGELTLQSGDALSQPAGVPHDVLARSDDLEVLEINAPSSYGTFNPPFAGPSRP